MSETLRSTIAALCITGMALAAAAVISMVPRYVSSPEPPLLVSAGALMGASLLLAWGARALWPQRARRSRG